jgi:hypothetical protein
MASKRLLLQTLESWKGDLAHIKERKAREEARKRKFNKKTNIKHSK